MENTYEAQAEKFLNDTNTTFKAELIGHDKYFDDDKESRDIYRITITREGKKPYIFRFGQSVKNSAPDLKNNYKLSREYEYSGKIYPKPEHYIQKRQAPSAYDVLACLTKYDVGTFENFCCDFGYDQDSRKAEKIYFDVQKEYTEVYRLFSDVMEQLQEIQ